MKLMGVGEKIENKKEFESTFKNGMYTFSFTVHL